jgi:hypothetical protein
MVDQPSAPSYDHAIMAYRLKINGFDVQCDSATDVLALTLRANDVRSLKASAVPENHADDRRTEHVKRSLALLSAVRDGEPAGLTGAELAKAVGIANPAGLGMYRTQMEQVLKTLDLKFADVVDQTRVNDVRRWRPGPKINEAIKGLKDTSK